MIKKLVVALLSVFSLSAYAYDSYGYATVYHLVRWNFSTALYPFSYCSNLSVDLNGYFGTTQPAFAAYGALNCPLLNGGFVTNGNGYIGIDGSFNLNVSWGNGYTLNCGRFPLGTLSGSCNIYDASGTQVGTALITYTP